MKVEIKQQMTARKTMFPMWNMTIKDMTEGKMLALRHLLECANTPLQEEVAQVIIEEMDRQGVK